MLFMLINRTRKNLTPEQYQQLSTLAQEFYDNIPDDVTLHGDWAANDGSRTFALLECDAQEVIKGLTWPFAGLVDIEVIPVTPVKGWGRR